MIVKWLEQLQCRFNQHQPTLYRVGHNVGKELARCGRHLLFSPQEIINLFGPKVKRDPDELAQEEEERRACPWLSGRRLRSRPGPGFFGSDPTKQHVLQRDVVPRKP